MINILCLFDYAATTGYATVSKNIVAELKKHFGNDLRLTICGVNYFPKRNEDGSFDMKTASFMEDDNTFVFSAKYYKGKEYLSEAQKSSMWDDDYGRGEFLSALNDIDFDGVFILQDLINIVPLVPIMREIKAAKKAKNRKQFKSIIYFPIDTENMLPRKINQCYIDYEKTGKAIPEFLRKSRYIDLFSDLSFFDLAVTFTEFGKKEIVKHQPTLQSRIKVIPHGIDTNVFDWRMADTNFKAEYFGQDAHERFIIGCINRNQPRKDIPTVILAFKEVKETWETVKSDKSYVNRKPLLYLHMNPNDPLGWDLRYLLDQQGLIEGEDYKFPPEDQINHGASVQTLSKIYNCLDVSVNVATGGGWELTTAESMACGVPCIVPAHTSFLTLSGNGTRCIMLDELYPICGINDNTFRWQSNYEQLAENILYVMDIDNATEISDMTDKAWEWMTTLSWDIVCQDWIAHFQKLFFK